MGYGNSINSRRKCIIVANLFCFFRFSTHFESQIVQRSFVHTNAHIKTSWKVQHSNSNSCLMKIALIQIL